MVLDPVETVLEALSGLWVTPAPTLERRRVDVDRYGNARYPDEEGGAER